MSTQDEITRPAQTLEDAMRRLVQVTAYLRSPDGCPWDRKQSHQSLANALIEECYEVLDAIRQEDESNLREELGDLLLHVLLHSQIASEADRFEFADVAKELHAKLVRRHPHVFGEIVAENQEDVADVWENVKAAEKKDRESALDGIPAALPSLLRAEKAGKKAARVGFDWPSSKEVVDKIAEETAELTEAFHRGDRDALAEEIGDLLFSIVNLARHEKMESEYLLHAATDKFISRFKEMEKKCKAAGLDMQSAPLESLEEIWQSVK